MQKEALTLLIKDMREILHKEYTPTTSAALRRLYLFEMMYIDGKEFMPNPGKKLVLLTDSYEQIVADEYHDDGRVHLLYKSKYATFDRENMLLDYQKVAVSIKSIVFEGDDWPSDLVDTSHDGLIAYFFGDKNENDNRPTSS